MPAEHCGNQHSGAERAGKQHTAVRLRFSAAAAHLFGEEGHEKEGLDEVPYGALPATVVRQAGATCNHAWPEAQRCACKSEGMSPRGWRNAAGA